MIMQPLRTKNQNSGGTICVCGTYAALESLGYAQPVKANAIMRMGFISPSLSRPYFVRPWPGWLIRVLLQRVLGYRLASRFATKPSVASRSQPNFEHPVRQCRVRSWDNYPAGPSVEFLSVSPASGLFRVWPPSYQEALVWPPSYQEAL
jgi:hypothetical protein